MLLKEELAGCWCVCVLTGFGGPRVRFSRTHPPNEGCGGLKGGPLSSARMHSHRGPQRRAHPSHGQTRYRVGRKKTAPDLSREIQHSFIIITPVCEDF